MKIRRKNLEISLAIALILSIILSFSRFDAKCENLRENILRLHIIANSDSTEDQIVKLKVRDGILKNSDSIFKYSSNLSEAKAEAQENIGVFQKTAENILKENGFNYKTKVSLQNKFFKSRKYENFTLPAGNYPSLVVELGEGKGQNWWCVVFPAVCLPSASNRELEYSTDVSSANMAKNAQKYVLKFKTVEIYEDIRNYFKLN